jgi:hypothetical protein
MKRKGNRIPINKNELFKNFEEQIHFLYKASELYDSGDWTSIKMASTPLRTLFYKQSGGPILIDRIPEVNQKLFYSSVEIQKGAIMYNGPISSIQYINNLTNRFEPVYVPILSDQLKEFHKIGFNNWIDGRLLIADGESFTRRELIKFVANQDGGGHVDNSLTDKYYHLVHNAHSDLLMPYNTKASNMHLALLRQVVHETLYSFQKMQLLNFKYDTKQASEFFKKKNIMKMQWSGLTFGPADSSSEKVFY